MLNSTDPKIIEKQSNGNTIKFGITPRFSRCGISVHITCGLEKFSVFLQNLGIQKAPHKRLQTNVSIMFTY